MFLCNIAVSAQERNPNRLILHKGGEILKTYSADEIDDITFDYVSNKEVGITVLNVDNNSCKVKFEMPDSCALYLVGAIPAESSEDLVQYLLKNNTTASICAHTGRASSRCARPTGRSSARPRRAQSTIMD